jgi:hypothetical protein
MYICAQALQVTLDPEGNYPIGTVLVWVSLNDRDNTVNSTLQRCPTITCVLDTEHATQIQGS